MHRTSQFLEMATSLILHWVSYGRVLIFGLFSVLNADAPEKSNE